MSRPLCYNYNMWTYDKLVDGVVLSPMSSAWIAEAACQWDQSQLMEGEGEDGENIVSWEDQHSFYLQEEK